MKKLDIKVPATIKDCSPQQLSKWLFICDGNNELETLSSQLDFKVQVVSIFSNISKTKLYNASAIDINEPFAHLLSILSYTPKEPKGVVEYDGKKYIFDKTFEKKTTGQIIDLKLIKSVYEDPIKVMAILYIEEGMLYSESDENDNVLNPLKDRMKVFNNNFEGDEFLDVFAFFLNKYETLNHAMLILETARSQMKMKKTKQMIMKEKKEITIGTNGQKI